jgi:hypothetical protein
LMLLFSLSSPLSCRLGTHPYRLPVWPIWLVSCSQVLSMFYC